MKAGSILLFLLFVVNVFSFEVPCTFTSSSGAYYDLSPLSLCDNSGYTVEDAEDGPFVINVCNTVNACSTSASICQKNQYNLGTVSNITFSAYSGGQGVTLHIGGGSVGGCPKNTPRNTIINFICDNSATTPVFSFVNENPTCTYNFNVRSRYACPTTKGPQIQNCPVYVYLVPHSHDDVGWLQTINGYYEGQVRQIIDTVVSSLYANPARKFIYVEQAFFWRWWTDTNTTDTQRDNFRTIYQRGQLEFVIGGWVMQDEACTTYGADINQMTVGNQFIYSTFGAVPTKGWQIDPFGLSSVTPTLNRLTGFDGHVINRVTNKASYEANHRLQFNWFGSPSLGASAELFTEILDGGENSYCDWLFTFNFYSDPVNSGNVETFAQTFYNMVEDREPEHQSNVLLAAWGCDFAFQNATADFHSMDILMNYLQQNEAKTHIYVKYATLSEYFAAVKALPNMTYPSDNGGDFFPLDDNLYWTGYYTSRPELKGWVRQGEAVAHVVEPLFSLSKLLKQNVDTTTAYNNIMTLRHANAEAQHHDGVTGTSVPAVVQMFENDLKNGVNVALQTSAQVLSSYISKGKNLQALSPTTSSLLSINNGQIIPVVIYNSLAWTRDDFVVLQVNRNDLTIVSSTNTAVPSQINPNTQFNATGKFNFFFQASVPPLGFQTYFVVAGSSEYGYETKSDKIKVGADTTLTNGYLSVTISGSTGRISNVTNTQSSISVTVNQNLMQYESSRSGAYAFTPAGPASPVSKSNPTTTVTSGAIVTEAYQVFPVGGGYAKQTIRLYKSTSADVGSFIELHFQIGVLPTHTEVVSSFATSINSQLNFYTDDNGFEFLARKSVGSTPIGGNYYPTVYASFIRDTVAQLTLVSERSHGVSSLASGELEVMIHRNPDSSDGFGPGLTDTSIVFPVVRVLVDKPSATLQVRKQPYLLNFPLAVFPGSPTSSVNAWTSTYATTSQFISGALPPNVRLLSFDSLDATSNNFILRLTHLFAVGEDPVYSQPATVDVAKLFSAFTISKFQETTLTANQVLVPSAPTTVTLSAKQIRTFVISF